MMIDPAGDQTVKKGEAVELQCKTKASSAHSVVWRKVTIVRPNIFQPSATQSCTSHHYPEWNPILWIGLPLDWGEYFQTGLLFVMLCLPLLVMAVNGLAVVSVTVWGCGILNGIP